MRKEILKNMIWKKTKWLKGLVIFLILGIIFGGTFLIYSKVYTGKIFPGVYISNLNLGGMTKEKALNKLQSKIDQIQREGFVFQTEKKQIVVLPTLTSLTDPDLVYEIISYDPDLMIERAYSIGRGKSRLVNLKEQLNSLINKVNLPLSFKVNQEKLIEILQENFSDLERPAENARLQFNPDGTLEVLSEKSGQVFDYHGAFLKLIQNIETFERQPILLLRVVDYPKIKAKDTEKALKLAKNIIGIAPIKLILSQEKYGRKIEKSWLVERRELQEWLDFNLKENKEVGIGLKEKVVSEFLKNIAEKVDIEAQDAKFEVKEGKVVEFQASQDGETLAIEKSIEKITLELIEAKKDKISLIISIKKAKVATQDVNDLGIREIIGLGQSNFAGSPENRRHNIKIGAESLKGLLIKPEEEFSLNKALGEVSEKTGYLPELVIKGNRTIPEYGGGLCQIGTTTFRVALDAGLPILERRNHSYRVSYYEPAGTDATIYPPYVDLKFLNDTKNYILFQTRIEGDELIFEFWGTQDGRKVELTEPKIFNIKNPGPTKYIETEDLNPGEKKCTERAHQGADTEFKRVISYPSKEIKEEIWKSHYRPWQEVCLIGKKATSTEEKF